MADYETLDSFLIKRFPSKNRIPGFYDFLDEKVGEGVFGSSFWNTLCSIILLPKDLK